jgi:hypothetical protein
MHLVLRKRVEATNEDFPNVTLVSHQAAKISYQAHCKVFPQVCLIVVEAETKYIDLL